MRKETRGLQGLLTCIGLCLTLVLAILFIPWQAGAQTLRPTVQKPEIKATAGFDSFYREGNWIPVRISLHNTGPDFTGTVSITFPSDNQPTWQTSTDAIYQQSINLPMDSQKEITLYLPVNLAGNVGQQRLNVNLGDATNRTVSTTSTTITSLASGDLLVGLLSDQEKGFGSLSSLTRPSPGSRTSSVRLTATNFPTQSAALKNFDLLVLDHFNTSSLSKEQIQALQSWINEGGKLIIAGGAEWQHTLSPLPADLLPIEITGTKTLSAGTPLFPPYLQAQNNAANAPSSLIVSTGTLRNGSLVLAQADNTPLVVQANRGQGHVYYLAYDPTLEPLTSWQGMSILWKDLLFRSLGDQLTEASNQNLKMFNPLDSLQQKVNQLLPSFFPSLFPSIWLILALLLGYLAVLGPIRLWLVRRFKNRSWSWRIVMVSIVLFSLLSYGLAVYQKGNTATSSSISVLRLSPSSNGKSAVHETDYLGIFVPNQGDFQVNLPESTLVKPSLFQVFIAGPQQHTLITSNNNHTEIKLQGTDIWSLYTFSTEQDQQVSGGITSQLTIENGVLTGTISNTLPYSLNDVHVLVGNDYLSLGRLAQGETKSVHLPLRSGTQTQPQTLLADHIIKDSGYTTEQLKDSFLSQNDHQQHMATLTAFGREYSQTAVCTNGVCSQMVKAGGATNVFYQMNNANPSVIAVAGPPIFLKTGEDPLLLPNSSVTLIGWADTSKLSKSQMTINGKELNNKQQTIIQAPLDVTFKGKVTIPSNFIHSEIVDVQTNTWTQEYYTPGMMSLSAKSSLTLEFVPPAISHLQQQALTIPSPKALLQPSKPGSNHPNSLQFSLYNWKTGAWETLSFGESSLTIPNAQTYLGPSHQILMRLTNLNQDGDSLNFDKPSLELQGIVTN